MPPCFARYASQACHGLVPPPVAAVRGAGGLWLPIACRGYPANTGFAADSPVPHAPPYPAPLHHFLLRRPAGPPPLRTAFFPFCNTMPFLCRRYADKKRQQKEKNLPCVLRTGAFMLLASHSRPQLAGGTAQRASMQSSLQIHTISKLLSLSICVGRGVTAHTAKPASSQSG